MSNRDEATERFPIDTADHVMRVLRDDGLYRHLRFQKPGTMINHFDIITWPGYLAIVGDMGDYVFRRLEDMFEFFRGERINPSYWQEKLQASCDDRGEEYSPDCARAWVKQYLSDYPLRCEPEDINYDDGEVRLYDQLSDMGFDCSECDWSEYTFHYIWLCHALVWGIKQYDMWKGMEEA